MATTAVVDRLTVTLAETKLYLRVDHDDEDNLLTELVDSAKSSADQFLNNPFTDSAGNPRPIPLDVKTWVLRRVAFLYEQRIETLKADAIPGAGTTDFGSRTADSGNTSLDYSLLRLHRLNPGL